MMSKHFLAFRPPAGLIRVALAAVCALSGCTTVTPPSFVAPVATPSAQADQLSADLTALSPGTTVLAAPPVGDACGSAPVPVVRTTLSDRVLFATGSDQPLPGGGPILDQVASIIRRDSPNWRVTVLGHTDAVGSDAYNMDLSRRRAAKVLRALADRGIDPSRLSAVAIGKRQPVAPDDTPQGRQQNRRVEFLVSECMGANLGLVQQTGGEGLPVQILKLDRSYGLAPVGSVTLRSVAAPAPVVAPAPPLPPSPLRPPAAPRTPLPPRYQPNSLAPTYQASPLGPATPY